MKDALFEQLYNSLLDFKEEFGHLNVPQKYAVGDYRLGRRVSAIRQNSYRLTEEQGKKLNDVGFVWHVHQKKHEIKSLDEVIQLLQDFQKEFGHMDVPTRYVTKDGVRLGALVNSLRTGNRKISAQEKKRLNQIGFVWKAFYSKGFEKLYQLLLDYRATYGDLNVKFEYVTPEGIHLGRMVAYVRLGHRILSQEQRKKLKKIGFVWGKRRYHKYCFNEIYPMLKEFRKKFGTCDIPNRYVTEEGVKLGEIMYRIRKGLRQTTDEEKAKLDQLGFVWEKGLPA